MNHSSKSRLTKLLLTVFGLLAIPALLAQNAQTQNKENPRGIYAPKRDKTFVPTDKKISIGLRGRVNPTLNLVSVVYVDDSFAGTPTGADPDGSGPATSFGTDSFAAIQEGVNNTSTGGTLNVAAGTYTENVIIDRAMSVLGPNAAIDPNNILTPRTGEAIVYSAVSNPVEPNNCDFNDDAYIFHMTASGVTIKGFTFDGDNPANTATTFVYNGASMDAHTAVFGSGDVDPNADVSFNIVKNIGEFGIYISGEENTPGDRTGVSTVSNNKINNVIGLCYGQAIRAGENAFTNITANTVTQSFSGVTVENFNSFGAHPSAAVSSNKLEAYGYPIYFNLHFAYAGNGYSLTGNEITSYTQDDGFFDRYRGIIVESVSGQAPVSIVGNTIIPDVAELTSNGQPYSRVDGIYITNPGTNSSKITITNNNINGASRGIAHVAPAVPLVSCNTLNANGTGLFVGTDLAFGNTPSSSTNGILVNGNNFGGNTTAGLQNNSSFTTDARYNYWGSPTGPTNAGNPGGTGAVINGTGSVNFTPFYTSPSNCAAIPPPNARNCALVGSPYNAETEFSLGSNPNCEFSYGYTNDADPNSAFNVYTLRQSGYTEGGANQPNVDSWYRSAGDAFRVPAVFANTTGVQQDYLTVQHKPDVLNVHPANEGARSVVRFTVPATGLYQINGRFESIDTGASLTDVTIVKRSGATNIYLFGDPSAGVINLTTFGDTEPFSLSSVSLNAGDIIDFSVGNGGNGYGNDSTGVAAIITLVDDVPEVTAIDRGTPTTEDTNATSVVYNVTFSEDVTGVNTDDFALNPTYNDASITSVDPVGTSASNYTVTVSTGTNNPGEGALQLNLVDDDSIKDSALQPLGGTGLVNGDFSGEPYQIDKTAPTVTIVPNSGTTNADPIIFTVTIGGTAEALVAGDVSSTGGSIIDFDDNGDGTYTVKVDPTGNVAVTLTVAAGAVSDAAGNSNAETSATVTFDGTAPTVDVEPASGQVSPTTNSTINFTVEFTENVTGFDANNADDTDFTITNGTLATNGFVAVDGNSYTIQVTATTSGAVTLTVPTGAGQDAGGNGNSNTDSATVNYFTAEQASVVDDDGKATISGGVVNCDSQIAAPTTIQSAINLATAGDTINVCPGLYAEAVNVNKTLTLLGPNNLINPNTGTRGAEAIIVPVTSDASFNGPVVVTISAQSVIFNGFTVDGNNPAPAVTSGTTRNGVDIDAGEGIYVIGATNPKFTITNNIIQNIGELAIDIDGGNAVNDVSTISNNKLDNIPGSVFYGGGIYLGNNGYANVSGNVITRVSLGIITENFYQNSTALATISNNTIQTFRIGIRHNLHYTYTGPGFAINNNTITSYVEASNALRLPANQRTRFAGIQIESVNTPVPVTFSGNKITLDSASLVGATPAYTKVNGIFTTNESQVSPNITVTGNTIKGALRGISHTSPAVINFNCNLITGNAVGIYVGNEIQFFSPPNPPTLSYAENGALIKNNNILGNSTFGMEVDPTNINAVALPINAKNNYWGAPDGPSGQGTGDGDAVSTNVDFTPFSNVFETCAPNNFPKVTIDKASGQNDPTNVNPITFTVEFTEAVNGFDFNDIDLSDSTAGGTLAATVTGTGPIYTVTVNGATSNGAVIAKVKLNAATAVAAPMNTSAASSSTDNSVLFDNTAPTVAITRAGTTPTNAATVAFTAAFDQKVTGVDSNDFTVVQTGSLSGATINSTIVSSNNDATYTITVENYNGVGTLGLNLKASGTGIKDTAGNDIATGTEVVGETYQINRPVPTVTLTKATGQADPTNNPTITFTAAFSEIVSGFIASDISFTGSTGTASVTSVSPTGNGQNFTITVTATAGGTITASIPAGAATSVANSVPSAASGSATVTFFKTTVTNLDTLETFPTIQAANDDADTLSGHRISAPAGTYPERVNVTKSLRFLGAQSTIDARTGRTNNAAESSVGIAEGAFNVQSAVTVTIDGFRIVDAFSSNGDRQAVLLLGGVGGHQIVNNIFENNQQSVFYNDPNTTFRRNRNNNTTGGFFGGADNTTFQENSFIGSYNNGAINTSVSGSDLIANNVRIIDNTFQATGNFVVLFASDGAQITGNKSGGTSSTTIFAGGGNTNTNVSGNTLNLLGGNGVLFYDGGFSTYGNNSNITINGNTVTRNVSSQTGNPSVFDLRGVAGNNTVSNNTVTFSGTLPSNFSSHVTRIRGSASGNFNIVGNFFNGGNLVSTGLVQLSGLYLTSVQAADGTPATNVGTLPVSSIINANCNTFTDFGDGVTVFRNDTSVAGGLPVGIDVNINNNNFTSNSQFAVNNGGTSETINAENNFYGAASGPTNAGNPSGTGDAVSANVDSTPFLASTSFCAPINNVSATTQNTNQNTPLTFTGANAISISDVDAVGDVTVTLSVTNGKLTLGGTSGLTGLTGNGTSSISFSGSLANANAALNGLTFAPTMNYFGPATLTITSSTMGSPGVGGGTQTDTDTVAISVNDVTAPSVTINQATGQVDPTSSSPINFTVTFSEAVTTFATGDVTFSGAGATTATVTGSGGVYNVAVSGMTSSGVVTASIAAGVAPDASNNPNTASTSTDNTVTFSPVSISGTILNSGGNPIPGVTFNVSLNGSVTATTTTNASGAYSFNGLVSGGNYLITPSLSGFTFSPANRSYTNVTTSITNANFVATGGASPRTLTVVNSVVEPGQNVTVPLSLASQGDETDVTFSLTYDPSLLFNPQVACGMDVPGCSLLVNDGTAGKLGVVFGNSTALTNGNRQIVTVTFTTIAPPASVFNTPVNFDGSETAPTPLSTSNDNGDTLPTSYTDGFVVFADYGVEGDILNDAGTSSAGDNNGDNSDVVANDLSRLRRIVAGLEQIATDSNQFQRADSAPRPCDGDGFVNAGDISQTRRYIANLDVERNADGPTVRGGVATPACTTPPGTTLSESDNRVTAIPRRIIAVSQNGTVGNEVTVPIVIDSEGNENAFAFSLTYDTTRLENPVINTGSFPAGYSLLPNNNVPGSIGVVFDSNNPIAAGNAVQLFTITFRVKNNAPSGAANISFTDNPTDRSTGTVAGVSVQTNYQTGAVNVGGTTAAEVSVGGRVTNSTGNGIGKVVINLIDGAGETRRVMTNPLGYYQFSNVSAGQTYVLSAASKRFTFANPQQVISISGQLDNIDFVALP